MPTDEELADDVRGDARPSLPSAVCAVCREPRFASDSATRRYFTVSLRRIQEEIPADGKGDYSDARDRAL